MLAVSAEEAHQWVHNLLGALKTGLKNTTGNDFDEERPGVVIIDCAMVGCLSSTPHSQVWFGLLWSCSNLAGFAVSCWMKTNILPCLQNSQLEARDPQLLDCLKVLRGAAPKIPVILLTPFGRRGQDYAKVW